MKFTRKYRLGIFENSKKFDEFLFDEPFEVLESKYFTDLWFRYGLVEQRIGPFITGPYNGIDIVNCMQMWIRILYNKPDFDLHQLEKEIQQNINLQRDEKLNKDPDLMITMVAPFEIIHREIDKKFGEYDAE